VKTSHNADAKGWILGRLPPAASGSIDRATAYAAIPRHYNSSTGSSRPAVLELFIERLHDYGCGVHRSDENSIARDIGHVLADRGKRSMVVAASVPDTWLPETVQCMRDSGLSYDELNSLEGVLTACALAIATTGTIVLEHSALNGRRALSLIPDYHLCVVLESQVVETVPQGVQMMRAFATAPITTVAGPSATSDIEMTRVKGVHGPRTLDIVLLS